MTKQELLVRALHAEWPDLDLVLREAYGEITVTCETSQVLSMLLALRDDASFAFDQLIDVCAVDYLT